MHKGFSEEVSLSESPTATRTRKSHRSGAIGTTILRRRWIACGSTTSTSWSRCPVSRKKKNIIGSRFVFKQKVNGRFKARLVVQGYVQEARVDYGRSYAPVLPHREHKDSTRHRMRARMASLADGRGGNISPSAHRQGRLRKTSTRTRPEGPQDWRGHGLQA